MLIFLKRLKGKGGDRYIYAGKGGAATKAATAKPVVISRTSAAASKSLATTKAEPVTKTEEVVKAVTSKAPVHETPSAIPVQSKADVEEYLKEIEAHKARAEAAQKEVADMRLVVDDLTKERDFYFDKLREVEVALQDLVDQGQGNEITDAIFKILYATAEGFEPVPDEVPNESVEES